MSAVVTRDYSLTGAEAQRSVAAGLASARWYTPSITRAELKELMRRRDGPAIRDTLIWLAALIVSGSLGGYFWGSWTVRSLLRRFMACFTARPPTAAGTSAAIAPRSRRNG